MKNNFVTKIAGIVEKEIGLLSFFLGPLIVYKFSRMDLHKCLRELYSGNILGELFKPMQIKKEISELLRILMPLRLKHVLEIGTSRGGTLLLLSKALSEDAILISIDLPRGSFGGGYPLLRKFIYSNFRKGKQKIILIRGDSHSRKTLEKVKCILQDSKLDFLFIDGDHTYEGVKKDFEMYSPLVRKGGIIAFHDIVPHDRVHDPHGVVGVPRFWNEIKHSYKYLEIVKDWGQGKAGIGVLYV